MKKRNREINIFNVSALDLFATTMGVFLIIALILMPYYLKTDKSVMAELRKTQKKLKKTEDVLATCQKGRKACQSQLAKVVIRDLDIVFVMDTTGSMKKQIDELRKNLNGVVRVLDRLAPSLRVGFVVYRDNGEAYITRDFPITKMTRGGYERLKAFIDGLSAKGGGDHPEAVQEGLRKAIAMRWRGGVRRIIVVIGDAAAHDRDYALVNRLASDFANRSRHNNMISTIYTSRKSSKHYTRSKPFFERLAKTGKGAYVEEPSRMLESILISILQKSG